MKRRKEWFEDPDNMPVAWWDDASVCRIVETEARLAKGEAKRNFGAAARACRHGNAAAMVNYLIKGGISKARGRRGWDVARDYEMYG